MQINLDPPLAWLLVIQMTAMMIAVIWNCVIYHFTVKKTTGILDRNDAILTRSESIMEKQLALMERAEKLVKRFEDNQP